MCHQVMSQGALFRFALDEHLDDLTHCPLDLNDKDLLIIAKKDSLPVVDGQNTADLYLDNVLSHQYNLYPNLKNLKHQVEHASYWMGAVSQFYIFRFPDD